MKEHFKVKHKILQTLAKHQDSFPIDTNACDRLLHFSEIEKRFPKADKNFLMDNLQYLTTTKEIYCSMEFDNSKLLILEGGRASLLEEKYRKQGVKELRDAIFDVLKIISTTVLLLIAIYTFVKNIYETRQNKTDIEKIKSDIQELQTIPPSTNKQGK